MGTFTSLKSLNSFNKNENCIDITPEGKSIRGSGGNYLSNEIFYRIARVRDKNFSNIKTGHIHIANSKEDAYIPDLLKITIRLFDREEIIEEIKKNVRKMFHKIKYLSLFILNYYCYSQNCDGSITFKIVEEGKTILFNKEVKGDVIYDKSKTYTLETIPIPIREIYFTGDFKEEMEKMVIDNLSCVYSEEIIIRNTKTNELMHIFFENVQDSMINIDFEISFRKGFYFIDVMKYNNEIESIKILWKYKKDNTTN